MRVRLPVLLALFVALAVPAQADDAQTRFDAAVRSVRAATDAAGADVRRALGARDWNAWWSSHDAYVLAMNQGVIDIESAMAAYLLGTLQAGGQIDEVVHRRIDEAAAFAGELARRRVTANTWAALTRRGVRPDKRTAALELMAHQGVYGGGGTSGEQPLAPSRDSYEGLSATHGRVPGTAEAAQYLSKWQYASLRAESVAQTLRSYEAELAGIPKESKLRAGVEKRVNETRTELDALLQTAREFRAKYFEAGGR